MRPASPRHRKDQRIVAQRRSRSAPRRQVRQRVRPAHRKQPSLRSHPAVRSSTHPVVGIAQRHAPNAEPPRQLHRPLHRRIRIQIPDTTPSIPPFHRQSRPTRSRSTNPNRLRLHVNRAVPHHGRHSRKAVHPMRIHTIARRLRKQPRAQSCPLATHPKVLYSLQKCRIQIIVRNAKHFANLPHPCEDHYPASSSEWASRRSTAQTQQDPRPAQGS